MIIFFFLLLYLICATIFGHMIYFCDNLKITLFLSLAVPLPVVQRRQPHQPRGVGHEHRGPPAPRQGQQQVLQAGQITGLSSNRN